ncbi:MAG: tetratricopeptide repeat protein [Thermodesulfobacteriota bacterium]|nr:tetratricopeptide repeat protein [Thermodesulfobacteriota bacterium]
MNTIKFCIIALTALLLTTGCTTAPGEQEFNKGIEAERADKLDLAQELFETALEKNPNIAEAHINLGLIFIKKKDYDRAWKETTIGLEMAKESKTTIVMGGSWQDQAALAYNNLAKIVFDRAIEAHYAGNLEKRQEYKNQTISLLEQAIELSPEHELATKSLDYVKRWPN